MEAAVDQLRAKGLAAAAKKSSRTAAEGLVGVAVSGTRGVAVEVNSETDFVAKNDQFQDFVRNATAAALESGTSDVEALKATLLAAPSLGFADPATAPSGVHLLRMLDRLGIGTDLARRISLYRHGLEAVQAAAEGRVALTLALQSEILAVPGAALAGLLPEPVNFATPYAAGVTARAADPATALALVQFLAAPAGRARFAQSGFVAA